MANCKLAALARFSKDIPTSERTPLMSKPILSICLPTFNRVAFLKEAIAAVLPGIAEHGPAVELVISDNDSTDGSKDFLHQFAHCANVSVYYNDTNVGAAKNFDLVVQRANGDTVDCWRR